MIDPAGKARESLNMSRWSNTGRFAKHVYVSNPLGAAINSGLTPGEPLLTINAGIALAVTGDILHIGYGTYDEAVSIPAGKNGLKVICEPGVYIINTDPGTVVAIASDVVYWEGGILETNGQIGMDINGDWFCGKGIRVYNCTVGFDMNAPFPLMIDCLTNETATTGFDISEDSGYYINCIVQGAAASRGFYLSHTNAENNVFYNCATVGCTAGGYETVAGADNNIFTGCTQSELCAGPTDAGANNSIINHSQDSQITSGNTTQEDIDAIYDRIGAPAGVSIAADLVVIDDFVDGLETSTARALYTMDFWSNPVEEKAVTAAQVTAAVGAAVVVADLPAGATIVRAIVMIKFRMVENTNVAENSLDCTAVQPIQVDDSANTGWVTAIDFVDEQFKIAAESREGGDVVIGDNDVAARVDGNDTYDFQWLNAKAHLANIQFNDIQMGIKIWYSI